ncbi:hypothetical protein [Streptomyces sp. NPDC089919]|uniref:hypothetical protein n=1 Tax=Streptomyces sp. NPDC089919 TaxID=3155188 RepID=UPI0034471FD6
MHPTRTTTKLLLGVACAVSAVSGCVNVNPAAVAPAASAEPAADPGEPQYEPRGGRGPAAGQVVVRAPALEALESAPDAPHRSSRGAAEAGRPEAAARPGPAAGTDSTPQETPDRAAPAPAGVPLDDGVEPPLPPAGPTRVHTGRHHPGHGKGERPETLPQVPATLRPADVCAMGRKFGQWKKDSPESRICSGVYGE